MKRSVLVGAVVIAGIGIFGFAITQLLGEDERTPASERLAANADDEDAEPDADEDAEPEDEQGEKVLNDLPRAQVERFRAASRPAAPRPDELDEFPPLPEHMEDMDADFQDELAELMNLNEGEHKTWYKQYQKTQKSLDKMYKKAGNDKAALEALSARNHTFQKSIASHGAQ
jgi:hypothetical protein